MHSPLTWSKLNDLPPDVHSKTNDFEGEVVGKGKHPPAQPNMKSGHRSYVLTKKEHKKQQKQECDNNFQKLVNAIAS